MLQDPKTGDWRFRPDLFDELVTAKRLTKEQLLDSTGGRVTVRALKRTMPHFTTEQLGRAITQHRMNQIAWTVHAYAINNQAKLKKDGKWVLYQPTKFKM